MIPIFNQKGKQIATMRETSRARTTLVCKSVKQAEEMVEKEKEVGEEGEMLG